MERFLISPPFGNWINVKGCTSVRGSFTWNKRPGLIRHTLRSFRHVEGGWINQIGLRNKGIRSVTKFEPNVIYSLVGLDDYDWENMANHCPVGTHVEVNLGCPNVHQYRIPTGVLKHYCSKFIVTVKLTPDNAVDAMAAMCMEAGARYLHLSNTLPTPNGGISGRQLYAVNLPIVARLAKEYPGTIIAGGGIYSQDIVFAYKWVGASYFSLSTVFLTPWRVRSILASKI